MSQSSRMDRFSLYECSVQSPESHIDWLVAAFQDLRGRPATLFREDFCGTFILAEEWVKRGPNQRALALDLDPAPLAFGKKRSARRLTPSEHRRLSVREANVLEVKTPRADLTLAGNFSFFIFKKRKELLDYFRVARESLKDDGMLVLEMAGGPGMIEKTRERRTLRDKQGRKFIYTWDQKSFDPITHDARYAIHFKFPDTGEELRDAFEYDWRLWSIPEVRDLLSEAGFPRTIVYWETTHRGEGTGEYAASESGDNAFSWIAYVVALR